ALLVGITGIVLATQTRTEPSPPIATTEEPPAIEPLEVEPVLEDDSLLAVADDVLEDDPTPDVPSTDPLAGPPSRPTTDAQTPTPRPSVEPRVTPARPDPPPTETPTTTPEPAVGNLAFDSQPWSTVRLGERVLGNTPIRGLELPVGVYELTLAKEGFPPVPVEVRIEAGRQTRMTVSLYNAVGRVQLRVVPWANVSVNGEFWATIPPQKLLILPPGEHTLTFENPGLGRAPIQRRIRIAEGEEREITINMMEE
ncbi:PEGA domain-containing protein, partial [Rubrivirga sp.]|uniref:PEGA domain-containing protein n=1 Tax=Rubrivirga sp. TaxID=1885344 RepID=UPI003C716C97